MSIQEQQMARGRAVLPLAAAANEVLAFHREDDEQNACCVLI
jgi:hypothetical protein